MKKIILLLLSSILIALIVNGCEKNSENEPEYQESQNETEEFIFFGYGIEAVIPDFLAEEQKNLYMEAITLYDVSRSPDVLDMERFFPLKEGQEYIEPKVGAWVPDYTTDDGEKMYAKSIGRYRKWEDFEKLITAVFTPEAFGELNKHKQFIEIDGNLYLSGAMGMPRQSYMPKDDKFKLISSSDDEIKFTVTGYFYDDTITTIENAQIIIVENILTKTVNGWRFSKFDVVWR